MGQIRRKILASTALAFLPAILIAALLARWISRRFGGDHVARGGTGARQFPRPPARSGSSEFGQLTRTLNETAANLQQTVEQLEREHAELEKVERVRKDFVINVSHELRTPLASIQGYTETLIDGALDDPEHNMRFLGIIRHNAERLARLTEDLLNLSRMEQKRQKFEFQMHPVGDLLRDAVDQVQPIAEKNRIRLEVEAAPDSVAWCDDEAVSQILSNLLDNAIKYTPAGGTDHGGSKGRRMVSSSCTCGIPGSASRRRTCPGFSSASTGWIRRGRANWAEPGSDCRSSSTWWRRKWGDAGGEPGEQGSTFFFTLPTDDRSTQT